MTKWQHREAASIIFEEYDNINEISPTDYSALSNEEDHIYEAQSSGLEITEAVRIDDTPVARIYSEKLHSHGLVTVVKNKFFCHCCRKNYCDHSLYFRNLTLDRQRKKAVQFLLENCSIWQRKATSILMLLYPTSTSLSPGDHCHLN